MSGINKPSDIDLKSTSPTFEEMRDQQKENGNFKYSEEAQRFADKCFPCEPPCDSYGICSSCAEDITFGSGYNFGFRAGADWALKRLTGHLGDVTKNDRRTFGDLMLALTAEKAKCARFRKVLRFWANETEWMNVPVEFQIKRARAALKDGGE